MLVIRATVEITPKGVEQFLRSHAGLEVEEIADQLLQGLATTTAKHARWLAPRATGGLRESIIVKAEGSAEQPAWAVIADGDESLYPWSRPGRAYAAYVELGGRRHWPPPEPIRAWLMVKKPSLGYGPLLESMTYLVSRLIADRGTGSRRFMHHALDMTLSLLNQDLVRVTRTVEKVFGRGRG